MSERLLSLLEDEKTAIEKPLDEAHIEVSRSKPILIFFLRDISGSMSTPMRGARVSRANFTAEVINDSTETVEGRCDKGDSIWNYAHLGGLDFGHTICPMFRTGELANAVIHPISKIAANADMKGKQSVWVTEDTSGSSTCLVTAMDQAYAPINAWATEFSQSHPPIVLLVSDGMQGDGNSSDLIEKAEKLKSITTKHGNLILMVCHTGDGDQVRYPSVIAEVGQDEFAQTLFKASSRLSMGMEKLLRKIVEEEKNPQDQFEIGPEPHAFVGNASAKTTMQLFIIGTKPAADKI